MDNNNHSENPAESLTGLRDSSEMAVANTDSRLVPSVPRHGSVKTLTPTRIESTAANSSLSAMRPDGNVRSRQGNYATDQNISGTCSPPGAACGVVQKVKALQPHGRKNYENTLVMPSNNDPVLLKRDPSCTGASQKGLNRNGAGIRPISSLEILSDCENADPKSTENLNGESGDFDHNEKRSITLPRYSSLEASPVVHDNIGRSGVKKIAKLWRFLTKRRPQSQTNLCCNPALMSNSLDSACQTEDDILDGLGVGNRFSIISNSSSFSSATAPSCFCAGLRLSCGGEHKLGHHAPVESGISSDMHTTTESLRAGNSVLVRGNEDIELQAASTGGQEVGQNLAGKVHSGNSSAPSVLVNNSGIQQRDRGAYRHFCCGVGSVGSASSSIVSLPGETRRDMAPGQVRSVVPDPPAIPSEPDVEQPQRDPTPPPPAIVPRGSGGSTIHTQIDYVHCLVPDLARIASCSYYWGVMDRYEAERLLDGKPEGTFLLRDSAQFDFLFSVSFRRYGRSLHARVEQWNHRFSFDSHDPSVFSSPSVCELIEHYKDPASCMFFEPLLTAPLPRNFTFSLQSLCRTAICSATTYDGIVSLPLPQALRDYLQYYHYKQEVRVRRFETLPVPPVPPTRPLPPLPQAHGTIRGGGQESRGGGGSAEGGASPLSFPSAQKS